VKVITRPNKLAFVQNRMTLGGRAKGSGICHSFIITLALISCNIKPETRSESSQLPKAGVKADVIDRAKTKTPSLTIENLTVGLFALRSSGATRIATRADIERKDDSGRWIPSYELDGANGYRIVDKCPESADAVPTCREINSGEVVVPVFWTGQRCSAQCAPACTAESYQAGTHRLVVHDCDNDKIRYEGPVFEMPKSAAMAARWQVASLAERATIYLLDPNNSEESVQARVPNRVVGFAVRRIPPVDLSKDLIVDLSRWLKQTGFDDEVVRRCKPRRGSMIGIIVLYTLPNGTEYRSEFVLDFRCNALLIVRDQGGQRKITWSYFDASRADILAILRRALPEEKGLM
jgi:hypothetical protein